MNQVTLIGRLTREPELRYVAGTGQAVATFTLAVDRDYVKKDGTRDTDFIDIQAWGKIAETCANYLSKGSLVGVVGQIRRDTYKRTDGTTGVSFRINANSVQFLSPRKSMQPAMNENAPTFEPSFEPNFSQDFEMEFSAINNEELPF